MSFAVLSYFRSRHDDQSYLGLLATILDSCALLLANVGRAEAYQVQLTFTTARHAALDLPLVLSGLGVFEE